MQDENALGCTRTAYLAVTGGWTAIAGTAVPGI